jgi:hypothetical protein
LTNFASASYIAARRHTESLHKLGALFPLTVHDVWCYANIHVNKKRWLVIQPHRNKKRYVERSKTKENRSPLTHYETTPLRPLFSSRSMSQELLLQSTELMVAVPEARPVKSQFLPAPVPGVGTRAYVPIPLQRGDYHLAFSALLSFWINILVTVQGQF